MILYHTTLRSRLASIRAHGLDASRARGRRKAVWLHTLSRAAWALAHLSAHHGACVTDLVTIAIEIPRDRLHRARRGIWYTLMSISRARLGRTFRPEQMIGDEPLTEES